MSSTEAETRAAMFAGAGAAEDWHKQLLVTVARGKDIFSYSKDKQDVSSSSLSMPRLARIQRRRLTTRQWSQYYPTCSIQCEVHSAHCQRRRFPSSMLRENDIVNEAYIVTKDGTLRVNQPQVDLALKRA
jgi:hypothetical protein